LEKKLRQAGFEVVFSSYANFILFPPIFLLRTFRRLLGPRVQASKAHTDFRFSPSMLNNLFVTLLRVEAIWLRRFTLPLGVSVIVVGKKGDQ
jgi:hypothetical protein